MVVAVMRDRRCLCGAAAFGSVFQEVSDTRRTRQPRTRTTSLTIFSCTKAESALSTDVDMTRHYLQSRVVPSYDYYDAPHAKRGASVASLEDWTLGEELSEERQRFLDEIERVICGIICHTRSYTYGRNQVRLRIAPHSAVVKSVNFTHFDTDTRNHT
jgi:hypothetical protein